MGLLYRNGRLQDSSLGGETEHTWGLGSGHGQRSLRLVGRSVQRMLMEVVGLLG
jgi:hypothetical protein